MRLQMVPLLVVTLSLFTPTNGKCTIEREVVYFGNDLPGKKAIPVNTEQYCAILCYTTPQCSFWTYSPSKNLCWLKDGKDRVQNKPDRVSGQKTCGIGKCHIDREVDYFGNDLPGKKKIPVNNEQDCVVLCYTTPQCSFWTYSPSKNLCWLKDGKDRVQYNIPDRVSGDKTCGAEIPSVIWDGWDWCSRSDLDKEYRDGIFPLIDAVNSYRRANGLRNLECDAVLVEVAYIHVQDQETAGIESSTCEKNGHNWLSTIGWTLADIATLLPQYSDDVGNIKTCCYKTDGADCMRKKPNELYSWYKPHGFEVSVVLGSDLSGASAQAAAKGAVGSWKTSKGHNDVLMAKGNWKNKNWKNIGCFRRGKWVNCWLSEG